MKKLTLEIESLEVESFATDAGRRAAGTVRAHGYPYDFEQQIETEQHEEIARPPVSEWSCPLGCTDGCTVRTCASGGDICCA